MDLANICGREYIIDYCVINYKDRADEKIYKVYVTDSLKIIGSLNKRYIDMLSLTPSESRTADEIISDLSRKLDEIGGM